MNVAWFLAPYKTGLSQGDTPFRYCAMDDFTPQIMGVDSGDWSESEILGGAAVVKVRASDSILSVLMGTPGFFRLPGSSLMDILAGLNTPQKREIKDRLAALGYAGAEIDAAFPNDLGTYTLGDVLRFAAQRRLKPRWDAPTQSIKMDGIVQACRSIDDVDRTVLIQPRGKADIAVLAWTAFLSGLYFGTGFRPARGVIDAFAGEAARLGLTVHEHSYDFLAWMAIHSSALLFRLFGAFPTTGVLDNFDRANQGPPPSASWSYPIFSGSGGLNVISNQCGRASAGAGESYWNLGTFGPDAEAYVDIPVEPANGQTSPVLWLRLANPGVSLQVDAYVVVWAKVAGASNDTQVIRRIDNDVSTTLGATNTLEYASGDAAGFEAIGSTLTAYRKPSGGSWGSIFSRTDATYSAAGYIGLELRQTTVRADNFGGGTVAAAAADMPYRPIQTGFVPRALRTMVAN